MNTLYEKYGGEPTIKTVVNDFYGRLQKSPTLKPFFEGVNVSELITFQINLFTQLMGGPKFDLSKYGTSYPRLPIKDENFLEVAEVLEDTLISANIEGDDIESILALVASTRTSHG
jgi:truncated hemoglobin YjbI